MAGREGPAVTVSLAEALQDRYRIERELGRGGMATVYLAHDLRHERQVAIKVLRPDLADMLGAERFLAEVRTTARLLHPNILTLIDSGDAHGALFYVMPYVAGESLRTRLDRRGAFVVEEAVELVRAVAGALEYAHRSGVLHRDVKPENILLHEGVPMVADFGVALAMAGRGEARVTATGVTVGTPAYMSPEQVMGERLLDGRSDQYALGCVLYEMISGRPPFDASSPQGLAVQHVTTAPARLTAATGSVPEAVAAAVARALAKDAEARFPSMAEFAVALGPSAAPPVRSRETSIAVLPFDNVSPDAHDAYLAEGLTDELLTDLSRIESLTVIARSSCVAARQRTRDVREVSRLLDVTHVLEGSVRRVGDRLRVTAQLCEGRGGTQLWAHKYAGTMDDVFAMQEDVSRAIVAALELTLTPSESQHLGRAPVPDVEAFQQYLRARQAIWTYDLAQMDAVLQLLETSIQRVGPNALLTATEAWVHCARYNARPSPSNDGARRGLELALQARRLDPTCAQAWFVSGWGRVIGGAEGFAAALPDLRRTVELDPSHADAHGWLAFVYAALGRDAEAARAADRAARLDPAGPLPRVIAAWCRYLEGRPEEARICLASLPEGAREDWITACVRALFVLAPRRQGEEVVAIAERWASVMPADLLVQNLRFLGQALVGERARARAFFTPQLRDMAWHGDAQFSLHAAQGLALIGESDEAVALLERAVDHGFLHHEFLAHRDPLLASLRTDRRFQALVEEARRRHRVAVAE